MRTNDSCRRSSNAGVNSSWLGFGNRETRSIRFRRCTCCRARAEERRRLKRSRARRAKRKRGKRLNRYTLKCARRIRARWFRLWVRMDGRASCTWWRCRAGRKRMKKRHKGRERRDGGRDSWRLRRNRWRQCMRRRFSCTIGSSWCLTWTRRWCKRRRSTCWIDASSRRGQSS